MNNYLYILGCGHSKEVNRVVSIEGVIPLFCEQMAKQFFFISYIWKLVVGKKMEGEICAELRVVAIKVDFRRELQKYDR